MQCIYCQGDLELVTGREIYPHRSDLYEKHFYRCTPCRAYVGCHPGTTDALGDVATAELRKLRQRAHSVVDPWWRSGLMDRRSVYKLLRERLGIAKDRCHIGMFREHECLKLIALFEKKTPTVKEVQSKPAGVSS